MNYQQASINQVAPFIASKIKTHLDQGERVLWLLSGGSGGHVCLDAAELLKDSDLSNLIVTMGDERYGLLGHDAENFQILIDQGLELPGASLYRPLTSGSRSETAQLFNSWLASILPAIDHVVSVTGIGTDGHAFGIKPNSAAVDSDDLVADFAWDDFQRITVTPKFVKNYIDDMIIQAYGAAKHPIIKKLLANEGELSDFPALIFNQLGNATLFSDYPAEVSS